MEVLGINQRKIARHLSYLRRAGLVSVRRVWKGSHYRITIPTDKRAARVFQEVREWLKDDTEMQRDKGQLVEICCAPESKKPISIQGAPHPAIASIIEKTFGE